MPRHFVVSRQRAERALLAEDVPATKRRRVLTTATPAAAKKRAPKRPPRRVSK